MSIRRVSKEWVKKAAEAYLKAREERIRDEREELIAYERGPYRTWFRGWRHRVRSVAIQRAKENEEWELIAITGGAWARKARQLKSLAELPGDEPVILSDEDADFLLPWGENLVDKV